MFDIIFVGNYWNELYPWGPKLKFLTCTSNFDWSVSFHFPTMRILIILKLDQLLKKLVHLVFRIFHHVSVSWFPTSYQSFTSFFTREIQFEKVFFWSLQQNLFSPFFFEIVLIPLISLSFRLHSSPWKEYWFCHRGVDWTSCFVEGHWLIKISDFWSLLRNLDCPITPKKLLIMIYFQVRTRICP